MLVDEASQLLAKHRITDDAVGYQVVLDLIAEHENGLDGPIPVAVETGRGLLVAVLRAGPRQVGRLYHCLQHREQFDDAAAFPASVTQAV